MKKPLVYTHTEQNLPLCEKVTHRSKFSLRRRRIGLVPTMRAYRSCKHDAAATSAGTETTWSWCCRRGWAVAAGALGGRGRSAAGVVAVVAGAADEPARPRCADAAAAAPAVADAEVEDGAPGCAAPPQLVPAAAPIADTP